MGSSHDKGKRFERRTGEFLLNCDGECPNWGGMTTDSGRTGQLSDLQVDVLSASYAGECKNGKAVSKKIFDWFEQIADRSEEHDKEPLLAVKKDGRKYKDNILHIITPDRHAELLEKERKWEERNNGQPEKR